MKNKRVSTMVRNIVLLIFVGIITYLPSLRAQFLWDDDDFIVSNTYVKTFQIDKFFTAQAVEGAGKVSNYFRPIQFSTYAIVYKVFGPNPAVFHGVSVFIHIAATVSLYVFLSSLSLSSVLCLLTSFIFLIHPVQTEAVTYISGLSDPLVAFFGFLSLTFFVHYMKSRMQSKRPLLISGIFYTMALLSKESGIIFLGLLSFPFLYSLTKPSDTHSRIAHLVPFLPFSLITLIYLLYHRIVIDTVDMAVSFGNSPYTNSVFVRLSTFLSILPRYILILLYPKTLFYDRDFSITILTSPWHLPSFIVLCIIVMIGLILLLRSLENKREILSNLSTFYFLLSTFLSFFIALIPFSGLTLINGIMYEHFLYIPLIFFFLFIFHLLQKLLHNHTRLLFLLSTIYFLLLINRSWIRQMDWQTPLTFYTHTLQFVPNSFRILNNLALTYQAQGNTDLAIKTFEEVIQKNPALPNPYHNIGMIYMKEKNYTKAEEFFQKAISVEPTFGYSYSSLVTLYQETNDKEKLKAISEEITKRFK